MNSSFLGLGLDLRAKPSIFIYISKEVQLNAFSNGVQRDPMFSLVVLKDHCFLKPITTPVDTIDLVCRGGSRVVHLVSGNHSDFFQKKEILRSYK